MPRHPNPPEMPEPLAYLNGQFVPLSEAKLSVFDMGVVHGASVTENIRTFQLRPFRLDAHLDRLLDSVRYVGFTPAPDRGELVAVVERVVEHNAALIPSGHELGIIVFVTAGLNASYVGAAGRRTASLPTVCVHTFALPFELWAEKYETGLHLVTPSVRQIPADCIDPRIKSRSRMHWYLADRQARLVDPSAVPLILDRAGHITETSSGNVFVIRGGAMLTPPPHVALGGISQSTTCELAEQLGVGVATADLTLFDALTADEVIVTSTPYCALPATRVNGSPVGDGRPGTVYRKLIDAWKTLAGVDIITQALSGASERGAAAERTPSTSLPPS